MNKQKITQAIEDAQWDIEKEQPSGEDTLAYYQHSLMESGYIIVSQEVLHQFFNHKSDANKYLDASQQEDLEAEFFDYLLTQPI